MEHIDPPSVYQNNLHWGVHHQTKIPFKKSIVYSSFPINKSEIIAITSNSIIRLEKSIIKETAPLCLSTAIFIKQHNVIVGVSSTTSEFFFIRPYDLAHHISTNVRTKQVPTFHILYSHKSSLLITAGKNIKVWNLKCMMPTRNVVSVLPIIEISLRTVFDSSFEVDLLNPPLFDYNRELLVLPESTGFNAYDMDCKFVKQMTKISASPRTAAAISQATENIITFDPASGSCYEWNSNGTLLRKQAIGNSSVVSCRFINDVIVIFLDSKNNIYLYDTQTMKLFLCDQLPEKPSSILLYYTTISFFPTFSVCYDNSIDLYEVIMPWKLWRSTMLKPHTIKICRRKKKAARVLVHTDNEYIYLISPKTQQTVTSSTPSSPSKILETFYDRGLDSGEQRDLLFTITYDDKFEISTTSTVPCTTITTIDMKVASVFECDIENKHYYGVATSNGEIIVHDYETFEPIKRYVVLVSAVLSAKYDSKYGTVLLFYENEIIRFDIATGNIVSQLNTNTNQEIGTVFEFKDNLALIGYKSGRISMIICNQTEMVNLSHESCVFHNSAVTGFSIHSNFFISVSTDQQMKFWSFSGSNILTLTLPLPLYSVAVINGKRDILVGTEKDLMVIEGRTLFSERFEAKDAELDNFNELDDHLFDDAILPLQVQAEQKRAMKSAWKEDEERAMAMAMAGGGRGKKGNGGGGGGRKRGIDEETRRKIIERMMRMGDDEFTLARIRERERLRFEEQKSRIQEDVDRERARRRAESEEEERRKREEDQRRRVEEEEEAERRRGEEEEVGPNMDSILDDGKNEGKEGVTETAEEGEDGNDEGNRRSDTEDTENSKQHSKSDSNSSPSSFDHNKVNNESSPSPRTTKTPRKKKKKKNAAVIAAGGTTGLVYIDESGRKFTMLKNGDWVDDSGRVYKKGADGAFTAADGSVWGGPENGKGHFETANGGQIEGEFAPEGTVWTTPDGRKYTSLGDGRWIGPDGEIYTMTIDGKFVSPSGKEWDGPVGQGAPEKWIGPDGKVYIRQPDGRYVSADGTVWEGPMDGSRGGFFESPDGSRPGDTFVDADGNVYTRTSDGWVGADGKLYRLGNDGRFVADDGTAIDPSEGQIFHQDHFKGDAIYTAPDGTVFKRTPSNRGWVGPDGKVYRLNKDGLYVAEDGSLMPLSGERLVWIEEGGGASFRPTGSGRAWAASDGRVYEFVESGENAGKYVCSEDGSTWEGPRASVGRFAGRDLFDAPIQWVDNKGTVYRPAKSDGSLWVSSEQREFERQPNGEFIEKVDSEEGEKWGGPGKPSDGNWVNARGQIIEPLGGYWVSPDRKVYTATKGGYISADGELYKPTSNSDAFASVTGQKWSGLGQFVSNESGANGFWVEASGDVFRPVDGSGNWEGPNGEIYSPSIDGHWIGQTTGCIWKGPPFLSARKYFIKGHPAWMSSFHAPILQRGWIPGLMRPSTPLYRVPPLLYPPFKSRFKAFQTRAPPRRKPRVTYSVPPPNIVCDPSQIERLILDGNAQLIPVARRLGLDASSEELRAAIERYEAEGPKGAQNKSDRQNSSAEKIRQTSSIQDIRNAPGGPQIGGVSNGSLPKLPQMANGVNRVPLLAQTASEPLPRLNLAEKQTQLPLDHPRTPLIPLKPEDDERSNSPESARPNRVQQFQSFNNFRTGSSNASRNRKSRGRDDNPMVGNTDNAFMNDNRNIARSPSKMNRNETIYSNYNRDPRFNGPTRIVELDKKFPNPVPLLPLKTKKDSMPSTAMPQTERYRSTRHLHTAYISRSYNDKKSNKTSRESAHPLIAQNVYKPKLSIPQHLTKPKRNF